MLLIMMDTLAKDKKFKYITCPMGFILSLFWLSISPRTIAAFVLILLVIAYVTISIHGRGKIIANGWVFFIFLTVQPLDISIKNVPGHPRFVPYVIGLPSAESFKKSEQGEVVLGGCIHTGFEPKWILVW